MTNEKKDASGALGPESGRKIQGIGEELWSRYYPTHFHLPSFLKSPLLFRCPLSLGLTVHCDWSKLITMPLPTCQQLNPSLNVWCNSDQWPMAFQNQFLYRQKEHIGKTQTISLCWTLSCLEVQQLSCSQGESDWRPCDSWRRQTRKSERTRNLCLWHTEPPN